MSRSKVTLDSLIDSLLNEASKTFVDTTSVQWETDHFNKIYHIVTQIKQKEAARDSSDLVSDFSDDQTRRDALFPAFITWLKSVGVNSDKVDIISVDNCGFGLNMKETLIGGEVAFIVPEEACITSLRARESKLQILADKDPMLRSMQNILLAVFLIFENYSTNPSFWKPYIDILPKTYDTILYFSKNEIMLLKHSPHVFRETVRMYCNIARQYAYFHTVFRKGTDSASRALKSVFTFTRYAWAVSSVITRQNVVPSPDDRSQDILCLVPLWDLCNHNENGIISTDYNVEKKQFICYASADFALGQEFKIFYGRRSSTDYFIHGGFVPTRHTDDFYCLELGIGVNDPNRERKKTLLGRVGMNCQNSFVLKPERLIVTKALFAFISIFQADKDMLDQIELGMDMEQDYSPVPTQKTWEFLATRFNLLKKATENSLASLLKSLFQSKINDEPSQQPITSRVQMILQLLKNEQKLLELLAYCCNDYLVQIKKSGQITSLAGTEDLNLKNVDKLEQVSLEQS